MAERIPVNGGGGKFIKWAEIAMGAELEGTLCGLRDGKFGLLADLETEDGRSPCPSRPHWSANSRGCASGPASSSSTRARARAKRPASRITTSPCSSTT